MVEREYQLVVMGDVNKKELNDKLTSGVDTKEGVFWAELIKVSHIRDEEVGRSKA
jgi:hypothetical protein